MARIGLIDVDGTGRFPNIPLRDLGYWAYVMIYDKEHCDPIYKRLQRWCNNRFIFSQCPRFEDYGKKRTETENNPTLWD